MTTDEDRGRLSALFDVIAADRACDPRPYVRLLFEGEITPALRAAVEAFMVAWESCDGYPPAHRFRRTNARLQARRDEASLFAWAASAYTIASSSPLKKAMGSEMMQAIALGAISLSPGMSTPDAIELITEMRHDGQPYEARSAIELLLERGYIEYDAGLHLRATHRP